MGKIGKIRKPNIGSYRVGMKLQVNFVSFLINGHYTGLINA